MAFSLYSKDVEAQGSPLYYSRPQYNEATAQLRRRTGRDYARTAQQLRAAGVSEADIPRMLTDQTIGAQQQATSLYNQALDQEGQIREARKTRRQRRLGRVLGMAIDIPFRIGQYKTLSGALKQGGSALASNAAQSLTETPVEQAYRSPYDTSLSNIYPQDTMRRRTPYTYNSSSWFQ